MNISKVVYLGDLRTEAIHLSSGTIVRSDAPRDNHGKGELFSPTDLVATATASCMLTTMGIVAQKNHLAMEGTEVDVVKVMANNPRRIAEIHTHLKIPAGSLSAGDKSMLENAATTCPVVMSLSPEIKKVIEFEYV
jgi:uncharacterized OsmC-like protein